MPGRKTVRIEVERATYARLKQLAGRRSMPLKALVRDALKVYVETQEGELAKDPLYRIVGRLKLERRSRSERKDWRP